MTRDIIDINDFTILVEEAKVNEPTIDSCFFDEPLIAVAFYGSGNVEFININSVSLGVFNYMNFIFLLIIPLLTMRLYSEEKKSGTIELLMTSPISSMEIMLGKYFSCLSVYSIMLVLTTFLMGILAIQSQGQLDIRPVLSSYLGTFLFGAAIIPIGMFFSSLTENQIVAGFTTISVELALWILIFSAVREDLTIDDDLKNPFSASHAFRLINLEGEGPPP